MQAIATLVQDDPYVKTPRSERIAQRRARRERLRRLESARDMPVEMPPAAPSKPSPEPIFSFGKWLERQELLNPLPKRTWFSIESEIAPPPRPKIEHIQHVVAKHYGVRRGDLVSDSRLAVIVRPRQVGYYLSKVLSGRSLPEIGRRFGGRDHTSILSGIRKIEHLRKSDAALESTLREIAALLGGSIA